MSEGLIERAKTVGEGRRLAKLTEPSHEASETFLAFLHNCSKHRIFHCSQ